MNSPKISINNASFIESLNEQVSLTNAINLINPHPDLLTQSNLIQLIENEFKTNIWNHNSSNGNLELRQCLATQIKNETGHTYNPENEIIIANDYKQAMFACLAALLKEGDQVIIFEPTDTSIVQVIELFGAQAVYIKLIEPDFSIDWEDVQKMINGKTKLILLNSPHNPTGWTMSEIDALRLQRIINGTKVVVLSDETFQKIVFDGEAHQSMAAYPKLAEQSVIICDLSRQYYLPSWSLAKIAGQAVYTKQIQNILQLTCGNKNEPLQRAFAKYLNNGNTINEISSFYQAKRNLLISELEGSVFSIVPSKGSCYQLIGFKGEGKLNDKEFAKSLITKVGVAILPLSLFNHEKSKNQYFRIDLTQPDEIICEAARRLKQL